MSAIGAYSCFPKKSSIKNDVQEINRKAIEDFQNQLLLVA